MHILLALIHKNNFDKFIAYLSIKKALIVSNRQPSALSSYVFK